MTTQLFDIAGAAVYWTLSEATDFETLRDGLSAAGFGKFAPEPRTEQATLKEALENLYPGHDIKALADRKCFEVTKCHAGTDRNEHRHVITARMICGRVETDSEAILDNDKIGAEYRRLKDRIPYHTVTRILTDIVSDLNGTTLRPTGGIYWLPADRLERWEMAADLIERASLDRKSRVYTLRTICDESAVLAVRAALTAEIEREAADIEKRLHEPTAGYEAKRTQRKRAEALRQKLTRYESDLGLTLNDLRGLLDQATDRAAVATLLESAAGIATPQP
jgi:hypothetical protein